MRRKRKHNSKHDNWDYYAMLELQDLRWRATAADIKEAFKRVSLRHVWCADAQAGAAWGCACGCAARSRPGVLWRGGRQCGGREFAH